MSCNKRHYEKEISAYLEYTDIQNQQKIIMEVSRKPKFIIGRDASCDIAIYNPAVSKTHCIIKNDENGDWILYDKSISGVFVNKERVLSGTSRTLRDLDIISVTGPFDYPFCFYTNETCLEKKRKINHDQNSSTANVTTDEVLIGNNAKAMVKENGNNEESTSSLQSKLKEEGEKSKLKEQTSTFAEAYLKNDLDLKLKIKMVEFRNILGNEKIQELMSKLAEIKSSLLEKYNELKTMEAKLFSIEHDKVKEKDDQNQNEETLKFKKDMMDLLENELQCCICHEIVIEANVLSCEHLICNFCNEQWKKKDCPICRTKVKKVVKALAIDSFIDKILQRVSFPELLENRKQLIEYRKKPKDDKKPKKGQYRKYL